MDGLVRLLEETYDGWLGGSLVCGPVDRLAKANRFAFLIGVLLDEMVGYESAWRGMLNLSKRLKREGVEFTPAAVGGVHLATLKRLANERPAIHRFPNKMAERVKAAARHLVDEYGGDANVLFKTYTAMELYYRLVAIHGINDKKANMAIRLLVDELGEEYAGTHHINVPVDVHVTRVFRRTGLVSEGGGRPEIQRRAVELLPHAPWKFDAAFHIGNTWCEARRPWCNGYGGTDDYEALQPCPLRACCGRVGIPTA